MTVPTKVVLLAGGQGERLWPLSTPKRPKAYLPLSEGKPLLRTAFERALALVGAGDVYVVTGAPHLELTLAILPEVRPSQIILEPTGRNTAPSLGLACLWIAAESPDAVLVALPADHEIVGVERWAATVEAAVGTARTGCLALLGITPTWPATGYGYIELGKRTGEHGQIPVYQVQRFLEKPDPETAQTLVQSQRHLWNSGMVVTPVDRLQREIEAHVPDLAAVLREIAGADGDPAAMQARALERFAAAPSVSIDYGVLERCADARVVPAHFGWCDVGDWASLSALRPRDAQGNVTRGEVITLDAHDLILQSDSGRLVAALGVSNLVVIDTTQALLICPPDRAQEVKRLAAVGNPLMSAIAERRLPAGEVVPQPWGREIWWAVTERYVAKILEVDAGHSLRRQHHQLESLYCQEGEGRLRLGDEWQPLRPGAVCTITPGTVHQMEAHTDLRLWAVAAPAEIPDPADREATL